MSPPPREIHRAGMVELEGEITGTPLYSADFAPTRIGARSWSMWNIAALWVGMSVCIPTYLLASFMIADGLSWWQALLTITLGNIIVLIPMMFNAHAGTRYGIPFPVFARAAFGTLGVHVPSLMRGLVACGWFGIQTWIGGQAIHVLLKLLIPGWASLGGGMAFLSVSLPEWLSFLAFWAINIYVVWRGTESIRVLETAAAPFLIIIGIALLVWGVRAGGGLTHILSRSDELLRARGEGLTAVKFLTWLTAMVGYWATLSLNIPDFTRFAKSQRDQMLGQAIGLPTTMLLFSFIGVVVTAATVVVYGEAIWDPVALLGKLTSESNSILLGVICMLALALATLSTNIAANVVAPANSIANLTPRRISFRMGGLITGFIGIVIMPWYLLNYYQDWLVTYSGCLGSIGGVLICDYLLIRRCRLRLADLYLEEGSYRYRGGFNTRAMAALAAGIVVALAGKLIPALSLLFNMAWFFAFAASFIVYYALMTRKGGP